MKQGTNPQAWLSRLILASPPGISVFYLLNCSGAADACMLCCESASVINMSAADSVTPTGLTSLI